VRARSHRGLAAIAAIIVIAASATASCGGDAGPTRPGINAAPADAAPDHDYLIPAGTAQLLASGERIEIVPAELNVRVGDVLRIVNEDDRGHIIGAFYVGAGETLVQTFSSPGELSGECSVHPSGSFVLTVSK